MNKKPIELTKKQMDYLEDCSLFTGSRFFGGFTENSDYDYVLHVDEFKKHFNFPSLYPYLTDDYYENDLSSFDSFRCFYKEKNINLIVVNSYICLDAWFFASEIYKESMFHPLINANRAIRHRFFQKLKMLFLTEMSTLFSTEEYEEISKEI